jgi:hypothetical protein
MGLYLGAWKIVYRGDQMGGMQRHGSRQEANKHAHDPHESKQWTVRVKAH